MNPADELRPSSLAGSTAEAQREYNRLLAIQLKLMDPNVVHALERVATHNFKRGIILGAALALTVVTLLGTIAIAYLR